tara:strand:- start:200 stop:979 length:780 start_codon:yes stop_codon:yes gene_type:complete
MPPNEDFIPIILAAGKGTRLDPEQVDLPKSLVKINQKPLIFYHLDNLLNHGFCEVIIVVGYKFEEFKKTVGSSYKHMKINYVVNEDFEISGTAWSLFLTQKEWLISSKQVLFFHGDVFYDPLILGNVLADKRKDLIVLDENYIIKTSDEMVVLGDQYGVTKIFKGEPKENRILGESLGINRWSPTFMRSFFKTFKSYKRQYGINHHWEMVLEHVLKDPGIDNMEFLGIGEACWININYREDLEEAKRFNFGKLKQSADT